MSTDKKSLKELHSVLQRPARYLERSKKGIKDILEELTQQDEVDSKNVLALKADLATLVEQRHEFAERLEQFDRQLAEETEIAYSDDYKKWEELDYTSHRLINEASTFIQSLEKTSDKSEDQGSQSSNTDRRANRDQDINSSFARLLSLLETQQEQNNGNAVISSGVIQARLPKLELPKFDGDPMKWKPFWDRFEASVDNNIKLVAVDKLSYLVGQLEGEPEMLVKSLAVTNDNYNVAVDLLKDKYGDAKMTVALLYRKLNEMKPINNDAGAIRRFVSEMDCLLGSLMALGQDTSDDNYATIILSKLPNNVVVLLEMTKDVKVPWTASLVREKLSDYLIRIDRAAKVSASAGKDTMASFNFTADSLFASERKREIRQRQGQRWKRDGTMGDKDQWRKHVQYTSNPRWPGSSATRAEAGPTTYNKSPQCAYCNGSHWSDDCIKYNTSDVRYQRLSNRCSNCLKEGHKKKDCRSIKPCFHCKLVKNHHSSLCFKKFGRKNNEQSTIATDQPQRQDGQSRYNTENEAALLASDEEVTLQTALIRVAGQWTSNGRFSKTRALLDPGANRTYCSEKLAERLSLITTQGPSLTVNRFGSNKPIQMPTKTAKMQVQGIDGRITEIEVSVIAQITGEVARVSIGLKKLEDLARKVKLADTIPRVSETCPIDLLIGNDYYLDFVTGEKIEVTNDLYLLGSEFGFILSGRLPIKRSDNSIVSMCGFTHYNVDCLDDVVALPKTDTNPLKEPEMSDYWSLETIGIKDESGEDDDSKAVADFQENIEFKNNRYSVSLPWNDKINDLKDDYSLCVGRFSSLVRSIKDKEELFTTYNDIIKDQLQKGVIERVEQQANKGQIMHYIPHHAVVTPQKETTKKVALIADIEKAFLQVGVLEKDRDALRFLWLKDTSNKSVEGNVQTYRFCRVLFGMNCSPALLAQTIRYHLKQENTTVANQINKGLYVDNVVTGASTVFAAKSFYKEAKGIFRSASMNLREWGSNSAEVMETIPKEDQAKQRKTKVLGIEWDMDKDNLIVSNNYKDSPEKANTKRQILSALSSTFDPLGLFTPVSIVGKYILQQLCQCQSKPAWDTKLSKERLTSWKEQLRNIREIGKVVIPRYVPSNGQCSLIAFCDASSTSYATAIYLRSEKDHRVDVNLILSKSRLNPTKKLTIPRLELMGILIGIRALRFVENNIGIPISSKVIMSDSMCALLWTKNQRNLDAFCRNRVAEICKIQDTTFRYVHTDENPADWSTRGKRVDELTDFWWKGPKWLKGTEKNWPSWEFEYFTPIKVEHKTNSLHEASLPAQQTEESSPFAIKAENYNSFRKLLGVTAWCQRFVSRLRRKGNDSEYLSPEELQEAKRQWERHVQQITYKDAIAAVQKGKKHDMVHLGLFLDTAGIIRCKGRLAKSSLGWESKFPILLPKGHYYVRLLVNDLHSRNQHVSVSHTLSVLRRSYWVPKGRSLVSQIVQKCVVCKKATGKPYAIPMMPELPSSRVNPGACFSACGVDYFGPLKLKGAQVMEKAWVCIFTCLIIRAVHLELVHDLSAKGFLMALRRFIARRGKPSKMLSDNGPQFKVVANTLDEVWEKVVRHADVVKFSSNEGISWSFIPAYAPYMGGVYERMVGIVKTSLRKTLGKAMLTPEQFQTLLCECEAVVNSRPLTYVDSNLDSQEILTPSHFLTLNPKITVEEVEIKDDVLVTFNPTTKDLVQEWKKGQNLLQEFWKRWSEDYLNELRTRNTYLHRHSSRLPKKPQIGHLVLIKDAQLSRGSWKIARIDKLMKSIDGEVRSVEVQVPSGKKLSRPVSLLIPFEMDQVKEDDVMEENLMEQTKGDETQLEGNDTKEANKQNNITTSKEKEKLDDETYVVWAKVPGYPFWPALTIPDDQVPDSLRKQRHKATDFPVRFFVTDKIAWVASDRIEDYKENHKKFSSGKKTKRFQTAIQQADGYIGGTKMEGI